VTMGPGTASTSSSAKRHIALFLADLGGGGAERASLNLASGFAARGHRVDLVLANAIGPYVQDVPDSVNVVDLERRRVSSAIVPLARYLRRCRPDVMLSTLHHACLVATIAKVVSRSRTSLFLREATTPSARQISTFDLRKRLLRWAMRWAYALADGAVAVSEGVADDLRLTFRVPRSRLWTLYTPVVTDDIADLKAEDPGHPWFVADASPVVLGVGRLHSFKGFMTLIDAFARVRADRPAKLVLLGEGPQRPALEDRVTDLALGDDVALPGFVANPFAFMARASVFALSSEFEGLPGTLIQAMACGCPVVATDCRSGPAEILVGGKFGTLIAVGDAPALADAILRTLDAPPASKAELRERAAKFAIAPVIDAHLNAFESTLGRVDAGGAKSMGTRDPKATA